MSEPVSDEDECRRSFRRSFGALGVSNSGPICIISWRLSEAIHRCYLLRVVCYWCMGASMHGDRKRCGVNVLY